MWEFFQSSYFCYANLLIIITSSQAKEMVVINSESSRNSTFSLWGLQNVYEGPWGSVFISDSWSGIPLSVLTPFWYASFSDLTLVWSFFSPLVYMQITGFTVLLLTEQHDLTSHLYAYSYNLLIFVQRFWAANCTVFLVMVCSVPLSATAKVWTGYKYLSKVGSSRQC